MVIKVAEELIRKIEEIRNHMYDLISEKTDLLDPEVVRISQMLDITLNEYFKVTESEKDASKIA